MSMNVCGLEEGKCVASIPNLLTLPDSITRNAWERGWMPSPFPFLTPGCLLLSLTDDNDQFSLFRERNGSEIPCTSWLHTLLSCHIFILYWLPTLVADAIHFISLFNLSDRLLGSKQSSQHTSQRMMLKGWKCE